MISPYCWKQKPLHVEKYYYDNEWSALIRQKLLSQLNVMKRKFQNSIENTLGHQIIFSFSLSSSVHGQENVKTSRMRE